MRTAISGYLLLNLTALVVVSKGMHVVNFAISKVMWVVKLCSHKIFQFLAGGAG